ncbi:MAG TPA: M28 family peptidase, partial [Candidatus Saccharimonadales bacterium]|nr:M28 family peptidase [Candidatus Saccharimonadales bacterium]
EFGCFGSRHEAALAQARGDSILAVINLDMLAYAPRLDSLYVITDARSQWLADSLVRVSRRAWSDGPALSVFVDAFPTDDSDHAPFRDLGYPAVMITEGSLPPRTNPTTHTLADTLGNLSMRAIRRTVQLVGLWLRELAEPAVALDSVPLPALGSRDAPNPATILESDDSLTLGGSVARVLSGVAEAQTWQILDMLYPFVSPPPPGPPASPRFGVGFPLCSVPGGVGFRPGTRVRLGPRRVGLRARDYGSYVLEEYWYHPPGRVGIEWLADWESWVRMVPRAGRADWDLGPHPNPLDPAAYPAATRVALRPGTPVDVRLLDVAGRAVYHARDAVRDAPGMAWVALAPPGAATLRSGIYFYQLTLGDGRQSHGRLVLLR